MEGFRYEVLAGNVVFGDGALKQVRDEVVALGIQRAVVITTPRRLALAEAISASLGDLCAGVYDGAVEHVPRPTVEAALEQVRAQHADGIVAAGGGSTIGLAKAVALEIPLPIVAVPTTYSGSEMTPVWGITDHGVKTIGKNDGVKPRSVIYDPRLTTSLPARVSATSGMNAIAHCVEGLYAENRNPISSYFGQEAIRALHDSLPTIVSQPADIEARAKALYGSWLAGTVLATVGMALHHKLCHVLGGTYGLPHADTHTVVLPYVARYNADDAPDAMAAVGQALSVAAGDAPGALFDLAKSIGAPTSLREIGMKAQWLGDAAKLAVKHAYYNPRPVDAAAIRELLAQAYEGRRP